MKNKIGIELHPLTTKALNDGATMFLMQTKNKITLSTVKNEVCISTMDNLKFTLDEYPLSEYIERWSNLQIGDEFYIQEEHCKDSRTNEIYYKGDIPVEAEGYCGIHKRDAKDMKPHQSKYKGIITGIQVKRVQDIAKTGYFDGADIDEEILKGLGFKWVGYFNRESYEEIGHKLFKDRIDEVFGKDVYKDNKFVFLYTVERKEIK